MYVLILAIGIFVNALLTLHNANLGFIYGGLMTMSSIKILVEKFVSFRINEQANLGKIIIMSTADLNGL